MVPAALTALADLKLRNPLLSSTPVEKWALFQLNRQSTDKGKFMRGERSEISSAVSL